MVQGDDAQAPDERAPDRHANVAGLPGQGRPLGEATAVALVFGASAAVLVVELVALRLLAPYLGLTLETSTLVIGTALTAIAVGSWVGGRWADRIDPARALAPLLAISAVAVAATPFVVRAAALGSGGGSGGGSGSGSATVLLASAATIVVPGALLSAVTPMVTKLRLSTLAQTGTIVGRLSGIATAGAIAGTVITGFVLITRVPVTGIMLGLGFTLLVAAAVVAVLLGGTRRQIAGGAVAALFLGAFTLGSPSGCDAETTYHCAAIVHDPARPDGRTLVLDGLRHSYVDLNDPTYLHFTYVRAIAAGIDPHRAPGAALRVHSIGAGGLTLPRYLAHARPGTTATVSEIDGGVVALDREALALPADLGVDVRVEDGRVGLRALPAAEADLVIGDAFGGVSVPWHLTTREAIDDVAGALRHDGIYAVNLIDFPPLHFARAELATLRAVFPHVAVAADPPTFRPEARSRLGSGGGNLIALASRAPLNPAAWEARLRERDVPWAVLTGAALDGWVGDAPTLTDDYAPVDQLLTPYPPPIPRA